MNKFQIKAFRIKNCMERENHYLEIKNHYLENKSNIRGIIKLIILKLGGSVITRKEADKPTINHENLKRITREVAESTHQKLIVVHGAGSFGHPLAKNYAIGDEIQDNLDLKKKMLGFSLTQHAVKELNGIVSEYLRMHGTLSVSIQPSSFILTKNKRIKSADLTLIRRYLELGFVPVIYGDVVLDADESIEMAVLSGDQIVKYLAENLKPERVILATDVDGIYDKNPKKYPDAQLIETVSSLEQIETGEETNIDVTGGMGGKVSELLGLLDLEIESEIINANKTGNIKKALNGEKVTGTTIKR